MMIRAGASNREMVQSLGLNINLVYRLVFALGVALAAFAGMIAAPVSSVYPGMGTQVLIICFVVVVIGGIGSIWGALVAALLIGLADTFGKVLVPEAAGVTVYLLMAAILLWRPEGLFKRVGVMAAPPRARSPVNAQADRARRGARAARAVSARRRDVLHRARHQGDDPRDLRAVARPARRLHGARLLRPRGVLRHRRVRARPDGAEVRGGEPVAHAAGGDARGRRSRRSSSACSSCA